MDFKSYQSRLSQLSARFNLMVVLVFGLLVSNVLLSSFLYKAWNNHTVEITPFSGSLGYLKSASNVDSHYLSLMAENFVNERLNVTPETVDANHQRLLSFVNHQNYTQMLKLLMSEAKVIKAKKMSSTFDITQIKTNPNRLTAVVSGVLKRYVGLQSLSDERKTYLLQFQYKHSRLSIIKFSLFKEKEDA
ncbi:type IV conjugative transfer system protein TraE [Fluoribacter dumoffii]|uniref:type IV conjugative transfer system protein TraE n=1 Tax=Fluoribacter dumoffii TaxID=463 RepID=UPI002244322C|nr:type IV conjugative transfer system protein TraE [Fluoribacter dumoffii]MCW8418872.1 type IV conjugative transfer system protein TraE [Fluoribacter dumoffii]MCW8453284.1 type IV conjugative transfer system protein TraE [Fluoribacter dumoffii]MCW8459495.1 type IV conjugative transfer system protein TraE [Fluoribacter dumoffii]MCW8482855.1 type IV conjugative transfer system protein TraE [Fluoribacter dumoffii]